MKTAGPCRALVLALLFACGNALAAPPGATLDPAAAWDRFLATAEAGTAFDAYDVLAAVGYDGASVSAARCNEQARQLDDALTVVPVSIALRRAAYLCAQATGDAARAERAMADLLALARYALRDAGDADTGTPIRIAAPVDASALVLSSGLEAAYAYYTLLHPAPYFPYVIAARDDQGVERHLAFDFVDSAYRIDRKDPLAGFPALREAWAKGYLQSMAGDGTTEAAEMLAVREAALEEGEARLRLLRDAAAQGGLQAARWWLIVCAREPAQQHCANGLVDALLPLAEQHQAYPMGLLALAYLEGSGVRRDPEAAWALLDGADRRWRQGEAYAQFARDWREIHGRDPFPAALQERLARAREAGNRYPRRDEIAGRLHAREALDEADLAFLADPAENAQGAGYARLADYYEATGRPAERNVALARAAGAGAGYAQGSYGFLLDEGRDGVARDKSRAREQLEAAAHGGDIRAARYLAWLAGQQGRWAEDRNWLLGAVAQGDVDALLDLAELSEDEHPGVDGTLAQAADVYRALADVSPRARRLLASLALQGRGMPKDVAQARTLFLRDAEGGDVESQLRLAWTYLQPDHGAVDEAAGVGWMERALASKDVQAQREYGSWLFRYKGTPEARARALALWAAGDEAGDESSRNELAWALCTAPAPVLDAGRGLAVAKRMGAAEDLPIAWLDTLAACHAAAGEYARAVGLQARVVQRVEAQAGGDPEAVAKRLQPFRERLALYTAGRPYRDASVAGR